MIDQTFPCTARVLKGDEAVEALAAAAAASQTPAVQYARAPTAPGSQPATVRAPATQGNTR